MRNVVTGLVCGAAFVLASGPVRSQGPSAVVAYEGARLIFGDGRAPVARGVLLVEAGRILQAGATDQVRVPATATRVDLVGKTVMPAMVNAHTHVGFQRGATYTRENYTRDSVLHDLDRALYFGVAAVLSQGIDPGDIVPRVRADQASGAVGGARLLWAGRGIGSPNAGPGAAAYQGVAYELTEPEAGRVAVREQKGQGVDVIKLWVDDRNGRAPRLAVPTYRAIIDEAHRQGLKANAHVFYLSDVKELVASGVDGLAHLARDLEFDDETVAAIVRRGVYVMPALANPERASRADVPAALAAWLAGPDASVLGVGVIDRLRAVLGARTPEEAAAGRPRYGILQRTVARLAKAGARLTLGSDTGTQDYPFGMTDHFELQRMVQAGAAPMQALQAATSTPAEYLGLRDLGTLTPGKAATFLVLDGNPLDDIANTLRIADVYVAGRRVDRSALRDRLSRQP